MALNIAQPNSLVQKNQEDQEIVIDTCRYIHACSTIGDKEKPKEGYSEVDEEVRSLCLSPKTLRQSISNLLLNNKLVVPKIVLQELNDFLLDSCTKLKGENKRRLKNLIQNIKGKVVEISIGANEYNLQKEVFYAIESEAQNRIKKIEKSRNIDLEGWEKTNGHKHNAILKEVYEDPVCKTWKKIWEFKEAVTATAKGLRQKPFLLNDFLIVLTAKKRNALVQTFDKDIKVLLAAYNQTMELQKGKSSGIENKKEQYSKTPQQPERLQQPQRLQPVQPTSPSSQQRTIFPP